MRRSGSNGRRNFLAVYVEVLGCSCEESYGTLWGQLNNDHILYQTGLGAEKEACGNLVSQVVGD